MAKLSKKEKLKLVRRYIGGQYVPTPEAFRSRTSFKASLLNWVKRYRLCGEKGLERKKRKRTSEADKEAIVWRCLSGERNKDLAEEYGVSCGAVSNWCRSYSQSGRNMVKSIGERKPSPMREKYEVGSAEFEKLSEKEQNKILKEELEYARTENAVLKKLRALGEQEEAARKKRR